MNTEIARVGKLWKDMRVELLPLSTLLTAYEVAHVTALAA